VAVFVAMNALANGFQAAMVGTGSNENVLLLRKGATNEMSSALVRQVASIVAGQPFIARDAQGQPLGSPQAFVVVPLARRGGLGMANVVARGVSLRAFDVRKNVRIVEGRPFRSGAREVVVGVKYAKRFPESEVGKVVRFAQQDWTIVGHFSADG